MIPVFRPFIGEEEVQAVRDVLLSGWIGLGPITKEFETEFAQYLNVSYAVATNSCTAALHLAMYVLNIKEYEVITTPLTFVSTNHAILYNGGIPVFCDIEEDTLNIDADKIEQLISDRTKGIIAMHYGGHACEMDEICKIARKYRLKVIEDAAHAMGGEFKGKKLGGIGDIGCFSFHAVKNLTTGEGGMIATDMEKIHERLLRLRWVGIDKDTWVRNRKSYSWEYNVREIGFKYHLNDIPAAIGRVQLKKLEKMNLRRQTIWENYKKELSSLEWLETPVQKTYTKSAFHNYVIKTKWRNKLHEYLKKKGISTGVHYIPNNNYSMYRNCRGETPIANRVWKYLLTLPLFPDLTDGQVQYIIDSIKSFNPR